MRKMELHTINQVKLKASEFIDEYERRLTERQYQKQKLKQNIMVEIMSNRHRNQILDEQIKDQSEYSERQLVESLKGQSRIKESMSEGRNFNYNQSIGESVKAHSAKEHKVNLEVEEEKQKEEEESSKEIEVNGEITFKFAKGKNPYTILQKEQEIYPSKMKARNSEENEEYEKYELENNQMTFREENKQMPLFNEDKETQRISSRSRKFNYVFPSQPSVKESENQQSSQVQENIQSIQIDPKEKGLFLTVEEDQSVEVPDQQTQNLAFDIVMDKSDPNEDLEILKKRKIEQLERKRQIRREASQKKVEQARKSENSFRGYKNIPSYGRKSQQKISDDPEPQQPPLHKLRTKIPQRNRINSKEQQLNHESHYQFRGVHKKNQKVENNSYRQGLSYAQTPNTVQSQNKFGKSRNKNNIFHESPSRHDKSGHKYSQQPKIQPKDRKNTFIKQSNRKLMVNAISNVCLPGDINKKDREKLLEVIQNNSSEFFVFLFKEYSRKVIKAIYALDHTQTTLHKIYGQKSPQELTSDQVSSFYRFDSGCREFKKLDGCKSFSLVVHAIDLR